MTKALFAAVFGFLLLVSPAAAADQWATYTNTEFGFSVELPGTPTVQDVPTPDVDAIYRLYSVSDARRFYGVAAIRIPKDYIFDLDEGVEGELSLNEGTLVSKEEITVQGFPARRVKYVASSGGVTSTNWFVLVKVPGGALSVVASQAGEVNQQDLNRVLGSFRIIK